MEISTEPAMVYTVVSPHIKSVTLEGQECLNIGKLCQTKIIVHVVLNNFL